MALNTVELPYSYFPDFSRGRPLFNADIYVGNVDTDPEIPANQKQVTVRQEDGTEVQIAQPVKTSTGGVPTYNGSPVTVLVEGSYSIKVLDRFGAEEYYSPDVTKGTPLTTETLPDYTDIAYKASEGNSAVENMLAGVPIVARVGDLCLTGGTQWVRIDDTNGDIRDFREITDIYAYDFGVSKDNADNSDALALLRDSLVLLGNHFFRVQMPEGFIGYFNNRWLDGLMEFELVGNGTVLGCTNPAVNVGDFWVFGPREGIFRISGRAFAADVGLYYFTGDRFTGASKGDVSIDLNNAGNASNYNVGDRVAIMGYAVQRQGYSPNMRFFEYKVVTDVSGSTITFSEPIADDYTQQWPDFFYASGGTTGSITVPDQYIGKPRIINLDGRVQGDGTQYFWPKYAKFKDLKFRAQNAPVSTQRVVFPGEKVIMDNCEWEPSTLSKSFDCRESKLTKWINVECDDGAEPDKLVERLEMDGGEFGEKDNSSMLSGVGIKSISMKNTLCNGRSLLSPIYSLNITNSELSSTLLSDSENFGPVMFGVSGSWGTRSSNISWNIYNKLESQKIIGESTLSDVYTITGVDAVNGYVLVDFDDMQEPEPVLRRSLPDSLFWIEDDSRIRGRVEVVADNADGTLSIRFKSGNLPESIKNGDVSIGDVLVSPGVEFLNVDGAPSTFIKDSIIPSVGLLNWDKITVDSPWLVNGITLSSNGSGTSGDSVTFPGILKGSRTYELTYDCTLNSGQVFIRASGSTSNVAVINSSGVNQVIQFTVNELASDLTFRTVLFDGDLSVRLLTLVN